MRKNVLWALDFGAEKVRALAAYERSSGDWQLLGHGEASARGVEECRVVKLTDAVEAVVSAVKQAEKSANASCKKIFFNYDDPDMIQAHPCGSKTLSGEGQIQRADVREAIQNASRLVGDYERIPVHSRDVHYYIDGKDPVANPFGVFGHRLDVLMHVVLSKATQYESWTKVFARAGFEKAIPMLSLVSSAAAHSDKRPGVTYFWDLGSDLCSGGVFDRGSMKEYVVFSPKNIKPAQIGEKINTWHQTWASGGSTADKIVCSGDLAGESQAREIMKHVEGPMSVELPQSLGVLQGPSVSALLGLLRVASDLQRRSIGPRAGKTWVSDARTRAEELIKEYF